MVPKEIFPLEKEQVLCDALLQCNGSMDDAIENLLSKQCLAAVVRLLIFHQCHHKEIVWDKSLHQQSST